MDEEYMDKVYENHLAARTAQREEEGRCGTCGAFDGPNHLCPHLTAARNWYRAGGSMREALRRG